MFELPAPASRSEDIDSAPVLTIIHVEVEQIEERERVGQRRDLEELHMGDIGGDECGVWEWEWERE